MNPIRDWIDQILADAKAKAIRAQNRRKLDEKLFLLAIEIGRGKSLLPEENQIYAQTFRTAQIMLMVEDKLQVNSLSNLLKHRESEWLLRERVIKAALEEWLKHPLSAFVDEHMAEEDRMNIIGFLRVISLLSPETLAPEEIPLILDKLDHPLDRA